MSETRFRRVWPATILALILAFVAGCKITNDKIPTGNATVGLEQWKCGDYFDGCGFLATDCVTLTANPRNGTGEVKFNNFSERTRFRIEGIERRWDWCLANDNTYNCAFLISVDGKGRYYNFRGKGRTAKPTDLFKCTKQ